MKVELVMTPSGIGRRRAARTDHGIPAKTVLMLATATLALLGCPPRPTIEPAQPRTTSPVMVRRPEPRDPAQSNRCVEPTKDALHRSWSDPVLTSVRHIADLDGDGLRDRAVATGGGSGGWDYYLYLRKGACGRYVGMVHSLVLDFHEPRDHGLQRLRGQINSGLCLDHYQRYRFDGTYYVLLEEQRWDCHKGKQRCAPWKRVARDHWLHPRHSMDEDTEKARKRKRKK